MDPPPGRSAVGAQVFAAFSSALHTGFMGPGQHRTMNVTPTDPRIWFKRWGWFHRPVSVAGGLCSLVALAFCVNVFLAIDRHAHSVSDALYGVYPFFVTTFLLWSWIAERTGRE
jgi:hypothetical protein